MGIFSNAVRDDRVPVAGGDPRDERPPTVPVRSARWRAAAWPMVGCCHSGELLERGWGRPRLPCGSARGGAAPSRRSFEGLAGADLVVEPAGRLGDHPAPRRTGALGLKAVGGAAGSARRRGARHRVEAFVVGPAGPRRASGPPRATGEPRGGSSALAWAAMVAVTLTGCRCSSAVGSTTIVSRTTISLCVARAGQRRERRCPRCPRWWWPPRHAAALDRPHGTEGIRPAGWGRRGSRGGTAARARRSTRRPANDDVVARDVSRDDRGSAATLRANRGSCAATAGLPQRDPHVARQVRGGGGSSNGWSRSGPRIGSGRRTRDPRPARAVSQSTPSRPAMTSRSTTPVLVEADRQGVGGSPRPTVVCGGRRPAR